MKKFVTTRSFSAFAATLFLLAGLSACAGAGEAMKSIQVGTEQGTVGRVEVMRDYDEFDNRTQFYNTPVVGQLESGDYYYMSAVANCEGEVENCAPSHYEIYVTSRSDQYRFREGSTVDLFADGQRYQDLKTQRSMQTHFDESDNYSEQVITEESLMIPMEPALFGSLANAADARMRIGDREIAFGEWQQRRFKELLAMIGPNATSGSDQGAEVATTDGSAVRSGAESLPPGCEDNTDFACAKRLALNATIEERATMEGGGSYYGQPQYFYVEPERPGILDIEMAPMLPNMAGEVKVFNAQENEVAGAGNATNYMADFNYGQARFLSVPVRDEKYYVVIDPTTKERGTEYKVELALDTEDTFEVNDSFAEAKEIEIGGNIQGKIKPEGDEDAFKIEVSQPGTFEVAVESVPRTVDIDVLAFNRRQERIAREYGSQGTNTYLMFEADQGTYYIVLSGGEGQSDDFYELTIRPVSD